MRRALPLLASCALLLAGCGGGGHPAASSTSTTTTTANPVAQLEQAVRRAVSSNASLSNWVLWHNRVPTWATRSTGGPALVALRHSAAERQRQHLRMRGISPQFHVLSIALSPSYTTATATVREKGGVRPYRKGKPLGKPIAVNEDARIQLRRDGKSQRFVVWKVESTR